MSPDPPLAEAVFLALRALTAEIDQLDALAAEHLGLNRTDQRALDVVDRAGTISATRLAEALSLTTGGVTTVLDRLERAGYISRQLDPRDRRRLLVEPTSRLFERQAEVFAGLIGNAQALIGTYDEGQLVTLQDFLERTRGLVAAHKDQLRQRGPAALLSPAAEP